MYRSVIAEPENYRESGDILLARNTPFTYLSNTMNDRILGYFVIALIILFLILPVGYLLWQGSAPVVTRTIAFKNVAGLSFLSVQDPVNYQGVEVGTIRDITMKGTTAFIQIETKDTLRLFEDYTITVVAKGVMGDRYLTIIPGTPNKRNVPANKLLYGNVAVGPDEALSYIGELSNAVHTLLLLSEQLKDGTADKSSLIAEIWQFVSNIDSVMTTLTVQIGQIDTLVQNGTESALGMLEQALSVTDTLGTILPAATGTVTDLIETIAPLVGKVERLINRIDSLVVKINDPELFIWKEYSGAVSRNLADLRALINEVDSDSLELPVRLW